MGFCRGGVWVMSYCGLMGYGVQLPAHQGSGPKNVLDFRGYGLWQAWVMRVPTVDTKIADFQILVHTNFGKVCPDFIKPKPKFRKFVRIMYLAKLRAKIFHAVHP